jgi:hypothetical protein
MSRCAARCTRVSSHRRQGEIPIGQVGEDVDARQCPQDPIKRRRVRLRARGQLVNASRAVGEEVGDAELRDDRYGHRDILAEDQPEQIAIGR